MTYATGGQPPAQGAAPPFPITTTLEFPEWRIERSLGMVFGLVVRSMGMVKGIGAGFKAMAGGEVKQYTRLVEDSRRHAMDRMIENAVLLGAERGRLHAVRLLRGRPEPHRDRGLRYGRDPRGPKLRRWSGW